MLTSLLFTDAGLPQSCIDVPSIVSGYYIVDVDGSSPIQPFPVYCDFHAIPPKQIIHHDHEATETMKGPGEQHRIVPISYMNVGSVISVKQVAAFLDFLSLNYLCGYNFTYECNGNGLELGYFGSSWRGRTGAITQDWTILCSCKYFFTKCEYSSLWIKGCSYWSPFC